MTSARLPESIRPIAIKMIQESAHPFSDRSYYGALDLDVSLHMRQEKCSVTIPEYAEVEEMTTTEFAGTFQDPDEVVYLVAYDDYSEGGIACACGKFTHLRMARPGTMGEFLTEILSDPDYQITIKRRE